MNVSFREALAAQLRHDKRRNLADNQGRPAARVPRDEFKLASHPLCEEAHVDVDDNLFGCPIDRPDGRSMHDRGRHRRSLGGRFAGMNSLEPAFNLVGQPGFVEVAASPSAVNRQLVQAQRASVEKLFRKTVRRATWTVHRAAGVVELSLELARQDVDGVIVRIQLSPAGKQIHLDGPEGVDLEVLRARLDRRLASRGYTVSVQ